MWMDQIYFALVGIRGLAAIIHNLLSAAKWILSIHSPQSVASSPEMSSRGGLWLQVFLIPGSTRLLGCMPQPR